MQNDIPLAMMNACNTGNKSEAAKVIKKEGKIVLSKTTELNQTPLHLACKRGYEELVYLFLQEKFKIDINALDSAGLTPLHWACLNGNKAIIDALLSRGAFARALTDTRSTPLHYFVQSANKDPLAVHTVLLQLIKKGNTVDMQNEFGETPLHLAASSCHPNFILQLLNNKANPNIPNLKGETALAYAIKSGDIESINILLRMGADPSYNSTYELAWKSRSESIQNHLISYYTSRDLPIPNPELLKSFPPEPPAEITSNTDEDKNGSNNNDTSPSVIISPSFLENQNTLSSSAAGGSLSLSSSATTGEKKRVRSTSIKYLTSSVPYPFRSQSSKNLNSAIEQHALYQQAQAAQAQTQTQTSTANTQSTPQETSLPPLALGNQTSPPTVKNANSPPSPQSLSSPSFRMSTGNILGTHTFSSNPNHISNNNNPNNNNNNNNNNNSNINNINNNNSSNNSNNNNNNSGNSNSNNNGGAAGAGGVDTTPKKNKREKHRSLNFKNDFKLTLNLNFPKSLNVTSPRSPPTSPILHSPQSEPDDSNEPTNQNDDKSSSKRKKKRNPIPSSRHRRSQSSKNLHSILQDPKDPSSSSASTSTSTSTSGGNDEQPENEKPKSSSSIASPFRYTKSPGEGISPRFLLLSPRNSTSSINDSKLSDSTSLSFSCPPITSPSSTSPTSSSAASAASNSSSSSSSNSSSSSSSSSQGTPSRSRSISSKNLYDLAKKPKKKRSNSDKEKEKAGKIVPSQSSDSASGECEKEKELSSRKFGRSSNAQPELLSPRGRGSTSSSSSTSPKYHRKKNGPDIICDSVLLLNLDRTSPENSNNSNNSNNIIDESPLSSPTLSDWTCMGDCKCEYRIEKSENKISNLPLMYFCEIPYEYQLLSEEDKNTRAKISSDLCCIDDDQFFVRGLLPIPINLSSIENDDATNDVDDDSTTNNNNNNSAIDTSSSSSSVKEGGGTLRRSGGCQQLASSLINRDYLNEDSGSSPTLVWGVWVKVNEADFMKIISSWNQHTSFTVPGFLRNYLPFYGEDCYNLPVRFTLRRDRLRPIVHITLPSTADLATEQQNGISLRRLFYILDKLL